MKAHMRMRQDQQEAARPGDEALFEAPEYLMAFVQRLNREQMESALRPSRLKLTSWRVLSCLHERGPTSLLDLADLSVTERTVTSRLVDRLIADRLVRKQALSSDKRFSMVVITAKGRQLLKQSMRDVRPLRKHLFAGFSQSDYDLMCALLKRLKANALTYQR